MSKSSPKQRMIQLMEWLPTIKKQPTKRRRTRGTGRGFGSRNEG
jgi:hypothetical protein